MKTLAILFSPCVLIHRLLIRPLVRLVFGVSIIGKEHLSHLDQFIIVANHNSHLDILLLFQVLQPDKICKTHPLAARDYFKKSAWLYKTVDFLYKPIWVDRNAGKISTFKEIQKRLGEGRSIIIFPEGTRGETSKIQEFKKGVGSVAKNNSTIPLIPVYLEGPERSFPKKAYFPIPLLNHITISPPQILRGKSSDITTKLYNQLKKIAEKEQRFRQHRLDKPRKPFVIAVIGIDGSGKSTLSRHLSSFFQEECCFIGDDLQFFNNGVPNNTQPLITDELRKWVGRKAKSAQNLAFYKIPKITELLLRDRLLSEVKKWYRPEFIFMDGAPLLNMTGWAILYHKNFFNEEACSKALEVLTGKDLLPDSDGLFKQFPELLGLRKLHLNHLTLPDAVIFLDVKPGVCIKRILSRGEKVQPHENIEKLTKLRNAYKLVCNVLSEKLPVLQITGDKDLGQLAQETAAFIKESLGEKNAEN
jgi:1-acyl-sn-glycerol-3-phosphate acyltransferase